LNDRLELRIAELELDVAVRDEEIARLRDAAKLTRDYTECRKAARETIGQMFATTCPHCAATSALTSEDDRKGIRSPILHLQQENKILFGRATLAEQRCETWEKAQRDQHAPELKRARDEVISYIHEATQEHQPISIDPQEDTRCRVCRVEFPCGDIRLVQALELLLAHPSPAPAPTSTPTPSAPPTPTPASTSSPSSSPE